MYISFAYLIWVGTNAESSLSNKTFVKNKKYTGYIISSILGEVLAIIALILTNYYIIIIALILPFVFIKIFGGEPELNMKNIGLDSHSSKHLVDEEIEEESELSFSSLVVYSLEAIHSVKNIEDVTSHFKDRIISISNTGIDSSINLEQEEYSFKFSSNKDFYGELSLIFLTPNPKECIGLVPAHGDGSKRLANFRVQLFCEGSPLDEKLKQKYNNVKEYITKTHWVPNKSSEERELLNMLSEQTGEDINCWFFRKNEINYLINIYYHERTYSVVPWISFSVSEVFYN